MTEPNTMTHDQEGHLCIAAKDSAGYYLGSVPYMAAAAMERIRRS